jgi:ABC-type multidrug transport system ATPase subunit
LVAEGEDRGLDAVLQAEFGKDAPDVGLDGLLADRQVPGNLPVAVTARYQPEYVAFARRERPERIRPWRLAQRLGEPGQQLGAEARGFLAQEIPLYRRFTTEDHIRIGAHMNVRWDSSLVRTRVAELRIPPDQRVGTMSGGQRAQVALALTLAKRPRLLLLDEPVAALDPLARRNFLATLTSAVADAGGALTVVLSSHLVTDLERVCDHIILLAASRVQLCGDISTLLAEYRVLTGPRQAAATLEELVLAYMGADDASAGKALTTAGDQS